MYCLTVVFGALGAGALLRFVERIALGAEGTGSPFVQPVMGVVFILLAYKSLTKARLPGDSAGAPVAKS